MARTSTFELHDRIVGGDLAERLAHWRAAGETFEDIAHHLRADHDLRVSSPTVRRWCDALDIPSPAQAAS